MVKTEELGFNGNFFHQTFIIKGVYNFFDSALDIEYNQVFREVLVVFVQQCVVQYVMNKEVNEFCC